MQAYGIKNTTNLSSGEPQLSCSVHEGILTIGQTKTQLYQKGNQAKIPDVVFYDTEQVLLS